MSALRFVQQEKLSTGRMFIPTKLEQLIIRNNKWSQYMGEIEHFFYCPYCGENISMLIDLNYNNQFYTEDCEVCCRPIEIDFTAADGAIESWKASRSD